MKINVVGTSGSGKSTLSKQLAEILAIPYIEMDQIYWQADWQPLDDEVFFSRLEEILDQPSWVLDGDYTRTTPIKWHEVDQVIWLDLPLLPGRWLSELIHG